MAKVKVNGIELYWEQHGLGPNLVLIPGFSSDHRIWCDLLPLLTPHFKVLLLDPRGAGLSNAPAGDYSTAEMAKDVAELLKALSIDKAFVFGQSMGGMIALQLAINHPQLVKKLILSSTSGRSLKAQEGNPPFFFVEKVHSELITLGVPKELLLRNTFAWIFGARFLLNEEKVKVSLNMALSQAKLFSMNGLLGQRAALASHDCSASLSKIECPTLILTGTDDLRIFPKESQYLKEKIKGAQLVTFEGCGHILPLEAPQEVADHLIHFLQL